MLGVRVQDIKPKFRPNVCVRLDRPHDKHGLMGIPKEYIMELGRIVQVVDNISDHEPMYAVQFFSFPFAFQVRESMLEHEPFGLVPVT